MLKKFSVQNFKQFKSLTMDFSGVRDYEFRPECLIQRKNGSPLIKTALVYGPNSSGKSNLGFALFDIVQHLVDRVTQASDYVYYLNADKPNTPAHFSYTFIFDDREVVYEYTKMDWKTLKQERLVIDDTEVFHWDSVRGINNFDGLADYGLEKLNWLFKSSNIAFLRYAANNSLLKKNSPIKKLMDFVGSMLWFRRVDKNNNFIGLRSTGELIDDYIIRNRLVKDFEKFLNANQVPDKLIVMRTPTGKQSLFFKHKQLLPFFDVASSGTIALAVYYYWKNFAKECSFIFMDEFDAFYHFEIAKSILTAVKNFPCQCVLTTHNTNLLDHRFVRPDVCFLIKDGKLNSLPNLTQRELREGNNLEKLFIGGEFND